MNPTPSTSPFRSPELRHRSLVTIALLAALAAAMSLFALRTSPATTDALAPAASISSNSSSSGLLGGLLPSASPVIAPVVTTAPVAAAPVAKADTNAAAATPTPAATTDPMAMPATDVCTGLNSTVDAFLQHFYSAHLETSLGQQVTDALNLDQYVKTHLVLVENMLKPLLGGAQSTLDTFLQHVYAAHLETGVGQQVTDALAIDQYVKTHTVLVENMIKPLVGADLSSC
jgi:hypothetical protein